MIYAYSLLHLFLDLALFFNIANLIFKPYISSLASSSYSAWLLYFSFILFMPCCKQSMLSSYVSYLSNILDINMSSLGWASQSFLSTFSSIRLFIFSNSSLSFVSSFMKALMVEKIGFTLRMILRSSSSSSSKCFASTSLRLLDTNLY